MTIEESIREAAKPSLLKASQNGHTMNHERTAALDRDVRVTWKCAGCGARLFGIAQGKTLDFAGTALTKRCDV